MECPIASNFPSLGMLCFIMYSICTGKTKKSYKGYAARESPLNNRSKKKGIANYIIVNYFQ